MNLSPIILFVYNRPTHTQATLEALRANIGADQSTLYIYADGPKPDISDEDLVNIKTTRSIIRQEAWCKEVHIIEAEKNRGLADSIVSGVTKVVNEHEKAIVLEDDIVTSPGFLQYMNEALKIYESDEQVMHVSGYMFPVDQQLPATFFYNTASCWGWGTWKRAWKHYNSDSQALLRALYQQRRIQEFNLEGDYPFFKHLTDNAEGRIKTWAVKWYASFFLKHGFALHPYPSLTQNIGNDGSGENSGNHSRYTWDTLAPSVSVQRILVQESEKARQAVKNFYRSFSKKKKSQNFKSKVASLIPAPTREAIKKKVDVEYRTQVEERQRLKELPRYIETTTDFAGKRLRIADAASFLFMKREIFDQEIYKFTSGSDSPYILDCGANIGLSILYFKQLYPRARIVGFEPDEAIFSVLEENIKTYDLSDVRLVKKGVWNRETTLQFFSEGADGGRVTSSNDTSQGGSIQTVRLRDFLTQPVDFLKIDIEGSETTVIQDCGESLRWVKRIFLEYHSFVDQPQVFPEILSVLTTQGFRYHIQAPGLQSKQPFVKINQMMGMDMQLNIYAYKA